MTPQQAYRQVRTAIAKGVLVRPSVCEFCGESPPLGSDGRQTIQAHHHDYDKPLDVEWICSKCHRAETPLPAKIGGIFRGSCNGQAKLTEDDIPNIRALRASEMSYEKIARKFRVDKKTIIRIFTQGQWSHA